jgi:hypothetical protein
LGLPGIDDYINKGLVYQNPFIYWFNHMHEPGFDHNTYQIVDGIGIIGGGLASLDVAKVIMFDLVEKGLRKRGIEVDLFALDRSIAKVLDEKGLTLDELSIKGCTLFYRRRIKDMPLSPGTPSTPEEIAKAEAVREKILNNYQSKYLFNMAANHMPIDSMIENGRLVGLKFQETVVKDGKVKPVEGTEKEIRFPYVISSIGSIPDLVPGIAACSQTYDIEDELFCRICGHSNVFALGNAVTGRGNIKESMDHGREISQNVIEGYLPGADGEADEQVRARIAHAFNGISQEIKDHEVSPDQYDQILAKVQAYQARVGYSNEYQSWIDKHLPERLENILGSSH